MRKATSALDRTVDMSLTNLLSQGDGIVFDAWALPWLSTSPAVRIWLESSMETRVMKSMVSHRNHEGVTQKKIRTLLRDKDEEARSLFFSLYGFDIFTDRSVFDLVLDVSRFICAPTVVASRESVRQVDSIISAFVAERIGLGRQHMALAQENHRHTNRLEQ